MEDTAFAAVVAAPVPVSRRAFVRAAAVCSVSGTGLAAAGCASSSTPSVEGGPVQVKQPVTLTAVLRPTQLEVDLQKSAFAAFEAKYPNLKVDPIITDSGQYDTKTDLLLSSGTPPALWWPAANKGYRFYAARSQFEELDSFVARDKYDTADFFPGLYSFCKWKGKVICLPQTGHPQFAIYNRTLLEKDRLTAPPTDWKDKSWNWAKLLDMAQKATKREGSKGTQFGVGSPWGSDRFYALAYGGDWFEPEAYESGYPKKFAPQKEAVIDAVQFIADLRHRHKVWPMPEEITELRAGNSIPTLFQTGKVAIEFNTPGILSRYADIKDFQWGLGAVPHPPTLPRNNWFYADQWCTFKGGVNRDAQWLLVKHMVSPEALRFWPLQQGAISSRKSLAAEWVKLYKDKGLAEVELKSVIDSIDLGKITPSHAIVEFADIFTNAIKPDQDKVLTNEQPMKTALDKITPLALQIMQRTASS